MRKQLVIAVIGALVAAPAWTSESNGANKEEKIGLGSGAAIGAMAGGPVGFVLGAALGGWVGDRFHRERSEREDFEQRYTSASADAESFASLLRSSQHELAALQAALADEQQSFAAALETALDIEVYFRTEQSTLDEATEERLAQVAELLEPMDDFVVIIEGHADARGATEYNDQLSAQRAAAVRDVLLQAGIALDRITARAAGEADSTAAEGDVDALALERRVDLTIVRPKPEQRVARQ
jgi:outer membrane protein OmpA-like peptidoglycan-associated protein